MRPSYGDIVDDFASAWLPDIWQSHYQPVGNLPQGRIWRHNHADAAITGGLDESHKFTPTLGKSDSRGNQDHRNPELGAAESPDRPAHRHPRCQEADEYTRLGQPVYESLVGSIPQRMGWARFRLGRCSYGTAVLSKAAMCSSLYVVNGEITPMPVDPWGDFTIGRWMWFLEDIEKLPQAIPACRASGILESGNNRREYGRPLATELWQYLANHGIW